MNSLWKAIGLGGSTIPNFDFTFIDENVEGEEIAKAVFIKKSVITSSALVQWTIRPATRKDDGTLVTVFEFCLTGKDAAVCEMARNAMKKSKTLMLPGFLRTYAATEHNDIIYIATEQCCPLIDILSSESARVAFYEDSDMSEKFNNGVALGLEQIGSALKEIHSHSLVHGNVSEDGVYVTKGGEWRLFALELVSPFSTDPTISLLTKHMYLLPEYRRVGAETATPGSADAWDFGCLIYRVYTISNSSCPDVSPYAIKVSDVRAYRSFPRSLQSSFMGLTSTNGKMRQSIEKFLTDCDFITESHYVQMMSKLKLLALMDIADRDNIYRSLAASLDQFPICICKHIVLGKLNDALTFGGGSATVLEPILKIAQRLVGEEFSTYISPLVISMYNSTEHLMRCRLLSHASEYIPMFNSQLVNDKIYPLFAQGFSSRHADIRELTVRALVSFAPVLNERAMINDVPKYIAQLQQDREGPIRTNSTICLSLIAQYLPESIKAKTLVNGFGRMLKDPFIPSKVAAIRSLIATIDCFNLQQIGELLIPATAPCTADPKYEVRVVALDLLDRLVYKMHQFHKEMPKEESDTGDQSVTSSQADITTSTNKNGFFESVVTEQEVPTSNRNGICERQPTSTITPSSAIGSSSNAVEGHTHKGRTARQTVTSHKVTLYDKVSSSNGNDGWEDDGFDNIIDTNHTPKKKPSGVSLGLKQSPNPGDHSTTMNKTNTTTRPVKGAMKLGVKKGLGLT
eukprot:Tbor_TRINITY_DN4148_c0_g1::TRINITY_DN4148_c0_g1_i1::g.26557::m.26557/K08876/SCYL1; SCY1-like protein 1